MLLKLVSNILLNFEEDEIEFKQNKLKDWSTEFKIFTEH